MKSENSKLVLGLLAGAAIGAAVAYLCTTDRKGKWIEDANSLLGKAKDGFKDMTNSVKDAVDSEKAESHASEMNVVE